ncbi:hypothetical protein [Aeoliella mucimassa]|uniref:MoxR-vWA-beta-propeller ternary system domain-containing protein n=1 Tax=Aeoliella mucimassa TaxID=2527972 RepID=A0A518AUF8_9BACT|nr:hypothetical protein [Aeoliella mucimassa]QDU58342.1 hypothetical protein Pan181_45760 [Aeoliella mucimassa]
MSAEFVHHLLEGRPLFVGAPTPWDEQTKREASVVLVRFEEDYRICLPQDPPELDLDAALWAAESFHHAASLLVNRDYGDDVIVQTLDTPASDRTQPETHYAVDLTMRFLPELLKLAKTAAPEDTLVGRLMAWAAAWPLSSVGVAGVGPVDAAVLRTPPMLLRLYVDRVIAASDGSRLDDEVVAESVKSALGNYPELSPRLAQQLAPKPVTQVD